MSCSRTLTGIAGSACDVNLSGVKALYLTNYDELTSFTLDASSNAVTAMTMDTGKKFHKYVAAKDTASMTSTLTRDDTAGTSYVTTEITGQFNKMNEDKRYEMTELQLADLVGLVLDKNGNYWLMGSVDAATMTAMTAQTGAGRDDGNFYNITITDVTGALPYFVDSSVAASVIE